MSADPTPTPPRDVFAGRLARGFFVTSQRETILDVPIGNILHAAVGYRIWERDRTPGMLARVGENYPQAWLRDFQAQGLDTQGVNILPRSLDLREFYAQDGEGRWVDGQPMSHFADLAVPLPNVLLGYQPRRQRSGDPRKLSPLSLRQEDFPASYQTATGVHFCPLDYLTHHLLPSVLRQGGVTTLTLDPCPSCMDPAFFPDFPELVSGLTAFLPSESDLRNLFRRRTVDLWEMAAEIGSYSCSVVVIRGEDGGQYVYNAEAGRRWRIPPYQPQQANDLGGGDAFCGGFLAGFREHFDPRQAALFGAVSASLAQETRDPFYPLDVLKRLPEARLTSLGQRVEEV